MSFLDLITIAELAEELDVTPQGVRYHANNLPGKRLKNANGVTVLNPEEAQTIRDKIQGNVTAVAQAAKEREKDLIDKTLIEEIAKKDKFITDLQTSLTEAQEALKRQQQLSIITERRYTELKEENEQLKLEVDQTKLLIEEKEKKKGFFARLFGL